MDKSRVLITGVSGLLGSNLAFCWRNAKDVLGIYHTHPVGISGVQIQQCDLLDVKSFDGMVKKFQPQVIVHCAALANIDVCETNHDLADQMNITATKNVCSVTRQYGSKVVFISTDAVYDGAAGNFSENDAVKPVNYYALTKLKAEEEVLRDKTNLVVRTSFYGFNVQPKLCLAEWIIAELSQKHSINGFTDVISSNIFTFDLAVLITAMMNKNLSGIFNAACQDALSKYDFACALSGVEGLDASLIKPVSVNDSSLKAQRSKNLSLTVERLRIALEMPMLPLSIDSMKHFSRARHAGGKELYAMATQG